MEDYVFSILVILLIWTSTTFQINMQMIEIWYNITPFFNLNVRKMFD